MQALGIHEIRRRFLAFFEENAHVVIPSASVVPENDPTLLFVNSGMYPLVPYLLGETHPEGTRLTNSQRCIRTIDIEEVGDISHLTFFEMLGFWSLGDYFKEDTIKWTWQFMTDPEKGIGLDPERLYVTVFNSYDRQPAVPKDDEAVEIWKSVGVPDHRIYRMDGDANWWDLPGKTGPAGPDTEIFYDISGGLGDLTHEEFVAADDAGKVVEIGNDVFMQYNKDGKGGVEPLPKKNVDVGWGLERLAVMVQGVDYVYDTDAFTPIIQKIEGLAIHAYGDDVDGDGRTDRSMRIIADHMRTVCMIIGDARGVGPSNVDQGYIVRRLIRRAIRESRKIGMAQGAIVQLVSTIIDEYAESFPDIADRRQHIITTIAEEDDKFANTIDNGLKQFEKLIQKDKQSISGEDAFQLFATYGFPIEMTVELAKESGANVDEMSFDAEFEKHQKTSRAGAMKKFKGGLADHSLESRRLHTATHLLHKALKNMFGEQLQQKGSNITPDRLRFDFNYDDKLTDEERTELERVVNEQIQMEQPVYWEELDVDTAKGAGAIGYFDDEYAKLGNKVKVYRIGKGDTEFAVEICGGPHVENTSELGEFKINSEKSSSAGIRRIKATVAANQKKS